MSENEKNVPKRRFKEFQNAEAWEQCELGDVAEIIGGGTPSTGNPEYWNGDIDWYSPTEIGNEIYAKGSRKRINKLGLEESSARILPPGKTVLFTSRAGIGDMAILQHPGATNQGFQSLVLKDGIDTYFIYSMGHLIRKYAEKNASGSTFLEISGRTLEGMPILVPSTNEQTQIGTFFSNLDNLITLHQRKLEKMKALKKAYLTDMFPAEGERKPKLRFAGFTDDWKQCKLKDVATFINGRAYSQDELLNTGKYEVLRVGNFYTNDSWYYSDLELADKYYANEGDLLYTWSATFGPHIWHGCKVIYHYHIWKIELSEELEKNFVFHLLEYDKAKITSDKNGSTMVHITKEGMENKRVVIPNVDEQKKISVFLDQLDNLITLHQCKLDKLQNIKKAYLNEMFI